MYFLKQKLDAIIATEKFIAMAPFGKTKRLRSDNGGEYTSKVFGKLMFENKIRHEFTAPYFPHQHGTTERSWKMLYNIARKVPPVLSKMTKTFVDPCSSSCDLYKKYVL